jgi:hypothetical protein
MLEHPVEEADVQTKREGWANRVWGVLNQALAWMVIHSMSGILHVETGRGYGEMVVVKIAHAILSMILSDLNEIVRPGHLYSLVDLFGVDWHANVRSAQRAMNWWGEHYPAIDQLIAQVDAHVTLLGMIRVNGGSWHNATCIMCFELLTSSRVCVTSCGHVFHVDCWTFYRNTGRRDDGPNCKARKLPNTMPCPICRAEQVGFTRAFP